MKKFKSKFSFNKILSLFVRSLFLSVPVATFILCSHKVFLFLLYSCDGNNFAKT